MSFIGTFLGLIFALVIFVVMGIVFLVAGVWICAGWIMVPAIMYAEFDFSPFTSIVGGIFLWVAGTAFFLACLL